MPLQFPQIVKRLLFPWQTPVAKVHPRKVHPGIDRRPARSGREALEDTVEQVERNEAAARETARQNKRRSH